MGAVGRRRLPRATPSHAPAAQPAPVPLQAPAGLLHARAELLAKRRLQQGLASELAAVSPRAASACLQSATWFSWRGSNEPV